MQFMAETEEGIPSGPLGLTLTKTPSFINLIESKLAQEQEKKMQDFIAQPMSEKLKASMFPASRLEIGSWQRISKNEGDLTAKIYYSRRRLVWELLQGALKFKIQVLWSDITAIRAQTLPDNGYEMLEIELYRPPSFAREINPQPRKHTIWEPALDFTGGQASICRKHTLQFLPGTLDEHYKKLLQTSPILFELSRKPFPNHELNPYFQPNPYYPVQNFPPPPILPPRLNNNFSFMNPQSPMSVMDPPFMDEGGRSYEYRNQWGHNQGVNNRIQRLNSMPMATAQDNYPVQTKFPPTILPPHLNNFTQKTGPNFSFMNPDSPMSVMDPPFMDEGGRSYAYGNQWGHNQGVNNNIQRLNSMPMATAQGNVNQNYSLNYGEDLSRIINPNNFENHVLGDTQATDDIDELFSFDSILPQQYAPPHQVSIEGMNVNSPMNTSMYQFETPQQYGPNHQASREGMNVNSAMNVFTSEYVPPQQVSIESMNVNSSRNRGNQGGNHHFQGLDSIAMPTAQGNANQNYSLNFGEELFRMNNPSNTENHLLGNTQVTCLDELSYLNLQQYGPPHQVSNAGMNVNPPMNTSMHQYVSPQQVSNEGMDVNSPMNTSMYQHEPTQQVSNEGLNVNSSMNTSTNPLELPELTEEDFEALAELTGEDFVALADWEKEMEETHNKLYSGGYPNPDRRHN